MSKIKIHELPEIRFDKIDNTDIMVIENGEDTWKVPVADMKLIFSNDSKIQAIYSDLLERIENIIESGETTDQQVREDLDNLFSQVSNILESLSNLTSRMVTVENNITNLRTDLTELTNRVTTTEDRLDAIDDILDSLNNRITALEKDNTSNKDRLTKIETKNTSQDSSITDINKTIVELKELIESYNGVSTDSLTKVEKELNDKIIEKYNELLEIIDSCHHQIPIIE